MNKHIGKRSSYTFDGLKGTNYPPGKAGTTLYQKYSRTQSHFKMLILKIKKNIRTIQHFEVNILPTATVWILSNL